MTGCAAGTRTLPLPCLLYMERGLGLPLLQDLSSWSTYLKQYVILISQVIAGTFCSFQVSHPRARCDFIRATT